LSESSEIDVREVTEELRELRDRDTELRRCL
jgi:hypothetical protein